MFCLLDLNQTTLILGQVCVNNHVCFTSMSITSNFVNVSRLYIEYIKELQKNYVCQ